jgi:hypothetical protein
VNAKRETVFLRLSDKDSQGLSGGNFAVRVKRGLAKSVQARPVEQFDHVQNFLPRFVDFHAGAQLQ